MSIRKTVKPLINFFTKNYSNAKLGESVERSNFRRSKQEIENPWKILQKLSISWKMWISISWNSIFWSFPQMIFWVGVNCSNCDCSTRICSTLLAANQLLDTNFVICSNPVNARQCRAVVIIFATVKCKSSIFFI